MLDDVIIVWAWHVPPHLALELFFVVLGIELSGRGRVDVSHVLGKFYRWARPYCPKNEGDNSNQQEAPWFG